MDAKVFARHRKLAAYPPLQFLYILYRRLVEQGVRTTWLWVAEKVARHFTGLSPERTSRILPRLYVGGQHGRRGLRRMARMGIAAVVNLREEADDAARGLAPTHYLWLPTPDDQEPTMEHLARGAAFIAEQIEAGRGVYVHCASGVGRAPTMAAAYLVTTGMGAEEAWALVRAGRPFIRPTPPQEAVVRRFERWWRERTEVSPTPGETEEVHVVSPFHDQRKAPTPGETEEVEAAVEERVAQAMEHLMEDEGLTGDLTDAQAEFLLRHAEARVRQMVAAGADDDLAVALRRFRRRLRQIARRAARSDDPMATLRRLLEDEAFDR